MLASAESSQVKDNLLVRAVKSLLTRPVRVASVEKLSENFRLISLEGDALKAAEWIPGQQIQITTSTTGLVGRT